MLQRRYDIYSPAFTLCSLSQILLNVRFLPTMPRQACNSGDSALPEPSAGADAQQQPESHESSLSNEAPRTTQLQHRLYQTAEELRQMQGRQAPEPAAPESAAPAPAIPVKICTRLLLQQERGWKMCLRGAGTVCSTMRHSLA